jgi:exosortase
MKTLDYKRSGVTLGLAIIAGLVAYLYGITGNPEEASAYGASAIGWMIGRWNWSGADMSHGWILPLVSLYILWQKRRDWQAAPKALSWAGFWVVVGALLLYLLGQRVQQARLVLFSLPILLWGIPYFLLGRTVAGLMMFPCGYLVLCIPMTFIDGLTLPLRMISTTISAGLLNGLGIAVTRVGTAMHVNAGAGFSLDVGHPCSGLRYLLAMVALTTAYAYFAQRTFLRRGILCLSAIPLAMAGNIARIVLIALVGVCFGSEVALGFYHDYSGYVVFAVAILLKIKEGGLLDRLARRKRAQETVAPAEAAPAVVKASFVGRRSLLAGLAGTVGLLTVTAGLAVVLQRVTVAGADTADILPSLPVVAGDWQGRDVFYCQNEQCARSFDAGEVEGRRTCPVCDAPLDKMAVGERNLLPADTALARKVYRNSRGDQMTVTIVLSGAEQKSIHRPQQCLPAQGLVIEQSRVIAVPLANGRTLKLSLLRAGRGQAVPHGALPKMLLAYWFAGGGHETPSHFERLAWMAWDNLAHGVRSRWAYVSMQTADSGNGTTGEQHIAELARTLYPLIRHSSSPQ